MTVPGAVPASMPRRLLAAVVDGAAALLLGGAFVLAGLVPVLTADETAAPAGPGAALVVVGGLATLALAVVQWWLLATRGATIGKRLVGLRAVSDEHGRPVGLGRALIRFAVPAAAGVVPLVGPALVYLSPLLDGSGRRRGWHDLAAGTVVYDVAVGIDPVGAPRASREEVARRLEQVVGPHAGPQGGGPVVTAVPGAHDVARPAVTAPAPGAPAGGADPHPVPPALQAGPDLIRAVPGAVAHGAAVPTPAEPAADLASTLPPPVDAAKDGGTPTPVAAERVPVAEADTTRPLVTSRVVPRSDDVLTAVPFPGRHEDEDVEMTRMRPARSRVPELPTTEPQATVSLSDGQRVSFSGVALVGRHPTPRAGESVACLIAVADPGRSVSKTHLAIGVDRQGVWVKDRASTNGTVVTLPDGQQILCGAHQQVRLPEGASVAFGDYGLDVAELSVVGQA